MKHPQKHREALLLTAAAFGIPVALSGLANPVYLLSHICIGTLIAVAFLAWHRLTVIEHRRQMRLEAERVRRLRRREAWNRLARQYKSKASQSCQKVAS